MFDIPVYSTLRGWDCLRRRYRRDSRRVPDTAPSMPLLELRNISGTSGWRTLWSVRKEVSFCTQTHTHTNTLTNTESLMQYTQMVVEGDKTLELTYKGKLIFVKNLHRILFVFHQDMWTQRIQMKASRGSGGKDNWIKCLNLKKRKKDETRGSNSGNHLNNLHVYQYVISGTRKYFSKTCSKLTSFVIYFNCCFKFHVYVNYAQSNIPSCTCIEFTNIYKLVYSKYYLSDCKTDFKIVYSLVVLYTIFTHIKYQFCTYEIIKSTYDGIFLSFEIHLYSSRPIF